MDTTRQTQRFNLRIPLKVRLADSPSLPSRDATSVNICSRGVYFLTNFPFQVGERVEVLLTMPEEVVGRPERNWRCHGRVVRAKADNKVAGLVGIGIEFTYYEVLRSRPALSIRDFYVQRRDI